MRSPRDGSEDAIHAELDTDAILFSRASLYSVIGMLALTVLFCMGVIAYTMRRNDLLKTEYYRLMSAIKEQALHGRASVADAETTDTTETMGPAPEAHEALTAEGVALLLTRKPLPKVALSRSRTRPTLHAQPQHSQARTDALYYDDLDSWPKVSKQGTRVPKASSNPISSAPANSSGAKVRPSRILVSKYGSLGNVSNAALGSTRRRQPRLKVGSPTSKYSFLDEAEMAMKQALGNSTLTVTHSNLSGG